MRVKIIRKLQNVIYSNRKFTKDNYKVRDHNHITGEYRGAACNECNLKLRLSNTIPVVFHNLKGYDSHLLMQIIGKFNRKINVIANNMEKYMSFSIGTDIEYEDRETKKIKKKTVFNLKFIDSFQFMSCSLEKLVSNLKKSGIDKFKYLNIILIFSLLPVQGR